ncbi:glycosyltransferase family 9 protein [Butyrivibrio sp. LC3010]|uniref:glycosyltransferase family 9 protein n=1 Tax=Butyrivibrio sp. LC3010 TaxID=1280680 RepID=UPI00040F0D31|nr:lipopolysaccharide heptosyltransferase family protein [Butyrivibrio sp. LC3010]
MKRAFPVHKIEQNSKVIMYGAGKNGEYLFLQNHNLQWCQIIDVLDQSPKPDFPVHVSDIDYSFNDVEYDYVLVSVTNNKIKKEIIDYLKEKGVEEKKIVADLNCYYPEEFGDKVFFRNKYIENPERPLKIGFHPGGVMGDNIISLRLYKEISRISGKCIIDVFTVFREFPEHIFNGQKNLGQIIYQNPRKCDLSGYDLVIQSYYEPAIISCNIVSLRMKSKLLAEAVMKLFIYQITDFFYCYPAEYMNRIQLERSRLKGLSCYTLLGVSGAFDINDNSIDFPLDINYEHNYRMLGLGTNYVTFNYGASDTTGTGKIQTKVWPSDYYKTLIRMIKRKYPNIRIIQIGSKDVTAIEGADDYLFGLDLEIIKFVLKNSVCHFDCEGGLVHMASQLGTKCFVLFGPTPEAFFGYKENTNITSDICRECFGVIPDWYTRCYKYPAPVCMKSIHPERVFDAFSRWYGKEKNSQG